MSLYEDFRRKVAGATVPLPMLYREDLSIDYAGIERYVAWVLEAGMTHTCLTHGYSQIESVTEAELTDVTRTIANVIGDRAVFIACTRMGSAMAAAASVRQIQESGAHAAFVMPDVDAWPGAQYREHLRSVANETELSLLFVSNTSLAAPGTPNLGMSDYEWLVEHENIVGLKEDFNSIPYRMDLIRKFGNRYCIIGGGVQRHYLFFHRYPQQGELFGQFSPSSALLLLKLLDEERMREAMELMDRREYALQDGLAGLDNLARNQVYMHHMGFSESWRLRPPLVSATEEQAREVIARMGKYPDVFIEMGARRASPRRPSKALHDSNRRERKPPDDIRSLLEGPVASIPAPFKADGDIDLDGVANIIEVAIDGGSRVILLTAGDSQLLFQTEDEIAQLTRFTIDRTAGRALTVAATAFWSTRQAEAFARQCVKWGADMLMATTEILGADPAGLAAHYAALARIMPVMLVGYPSHDVLDMLDDEPGICCLKEDGEEAYAVQTLQKYSHRLKIMTGGWLWRHLLEWPFGCTAFMDWSTSFAPHVGAGYWQALRRGDVTEAARVTVEVEKPMRDLGDALASKGGWQTVWRAALELNGIAPRYLRPPQSSASDEDIERIGSIMDQVGLLSKP